jgi:hypothetical protein
LLRPARSVLSMQTLSHFSITLSAIMVSQPVRNIYWVSHSKPKIKHAFSNFKNSFAIWKRAIYGRQCPIYCWPLVRIY